MYVLDVNRNKKNTGICPVKTTRQTRGLLRRVIGMTEIRHSQESAKRFYYMVRRDRNSEMGEEIENVEGVGTPKWGRQTE